MCPALNHIGVHINNVLSATAVSYSQKQHKIQQFLLSSNFRKSLGRGLLNTYYIDLNRLSTCWPVAAQLS